MRRWRASLDPSEAPRRRPTARRRGCAPPGRQTTARSRSAPTDRRPRTTAGRRRAAPAAGGRRRDRRRRPHRRGPGGRLATRPRGRSGRGADRRSRGEVAGRPAAVLDGRRLAHQGARLLGEQLGADEVVEVVAALHRHAGGLQAAQRSLLHGGTLLGPGSRGAVAAGRQLGERALDARPQLHRAGDGTVRGSAIGRGLSPPAAAVRLRLARTRRAMSRRPRRRGRAPAERRSAQGRRPSSSWRGRLPRRWPVRRRARRARRAPARKTWPQRRLSQSASALIISFRRDAARRAASRVRAARPARTCPRSRPRP